MTRGYNNFRRVCAVIVGLVYIVSAWFKICDPVGTGLIVGEYLNFLHIGFLRGLKMAIGLGLSFFEMCIGIALVGGVMRKFFAYAVTVLTGFFLLLTLALYIVNPEMDCGCFGEAVHLSHFQSFVKNVVLIALCLFAFIPFKDYGKMHKRKLVQGILALLLCIWVSVSALLNLPRVDRTSLKIGTVLSEPKVSMADELLFIYSKDGVEESFNLENLPDSTWTFVRTENAPQAAESDVISLRDSEGIYHYDLLQGDNVLVLSVYEPVDLAYSQKVLDLGESLGVPVLLVASASGLLPEAIVRPVFYTDLRTILSLNRDSAGLTLFSDGVITQKWSSKNLPEPDSIASILETDPAVTVATTATHNRQISQILLLILLLLAAV